MVTPEERLAFTNEARDRLLRITRWLDEVRHDNDTPEHLLKYSEKVEAEVESLLQFVKEKRPK